jgi:hypothetical protein
MRARDPRPAPSADELAAIAAAYLIVARAAQTAAAPPAQPSRWSMAGRLAPAGRARGAAIASRWTAAGRLDG